MHEGLQAPVDAVRRLDPDRLAPRLSEYGWRVLLATVALALVAGLVYPLSRTTIPEDPLLQSFDCAAPPCFPRTTASVVGDVLVRLPPVGYAIAFVLCVPGLLMGIRRLLGGSRRRSLPLVTTFLGVTAVLLAADLVPHIVNPCPALGPGLPGACGEFAGRWDVQDRWHTLMHTLFGALPALLAFGWWSGRLRPRRPS